MPELPDIIPDAPVVVPATEAKTYDKLWMNMMIVRAPLPSEPCKISFTFLPYDGVEGILQAPMTQNTIPDVFALASKDPQFAQVFGGVLAMVNKYKSVDFSREFTVDPTTYEVTQENKPDVQS